MTWTAIYHDAGEGEVYGYVTGPDGRAICALAGPAEAVRETCEMIAAAPALAEAARRVVRIFDGLALAPGGAIEKLKQALPPACTAAAESPHAPPPPHETVPARTTGDQRGSAAEGTPHGFRHTLPASAS